MPATMVINGILNFGQVINWVMKTADVGHKQGKGSGRRATHPTQFFWEYPPPPTPQGSYVIVMINRIFTHSTSLHKLLLRTGGEALTSVKGSPQMGAALLTD